MDKIRKKRVTLNDIAELTGVSKTTVSLILNGQADQFRIHPETCRRVKEAAQEQGYRANAYAKALQAQRTNVIGMVIPDLTNYGFASTAKALEKHCNENGLQLIIAGSDDNPQQEKQAIERLLDRQIDLLVTAPTHQDPNYYKSICKFTPLIQLDRYVTQQEMKAVISLDTPKIAELVVKMVQRYRPKEFFYLGGQLALSPSQSRLAGFKQGLAESGMTPDESQIRHRDYQPESGYIMMAEIVSELGRLPEAVFTASYTILEGVLRYLTEHQQFSALVERKLHLATFDNHDMLDALPFHIHSIKQNHQEIAHRLFEQIQLRLNQQTNENVSVECEIVWRDN